ncbi:uncharacterized protein LOC122263774 isoform X2 [Penaeus japonicus]|nr:uncharacterized protein LOC122263774 isoform X2 [Penaeus japonicus]XP_042888331.1 uncharacterized protein LOC122263774 isoform X2 [Penaeus japonicus]
MLSMISETPSNNLCESESPMMTVCEVDNGEEVSLTPDVEDLSTDNENSIGSTNRDSSLRQLKNFRVNRIEAVSVQNFDRGIDVTPVRIENKETNTNQIDSSVCVNSQSTMGGLRNFRMDKEESSKDQTLLLRYFRKEMKSSINTKLTKKDNHASSEKLKIWSHEGVLQLVEAYRTHMHMFSMTSLNSSQIWNKIAKKLQENGYTYTGELCKRKMQNLSTRYKSITENQESGSGRIRWSKWEYFDTMQDLFTNNPSGETSLATSLDTSLPTDPDDDPLQVDEIKTERDSPSAEYTNNSLSWNGIKTEVCHSSSEPEDDSFSWDEVKVEESSLFPEPVDDPALWSGVKMELCSTSPS